MNCEFVDLWICEVDGSNKRERKERSKERERERGKRGGDFLFLPIA